MFMFMILFQGQDEGLQSELFFGGWGQAISNKTTFTILHLLKP